MAMPGVSFDRAASFYDATRGYPPGVAEQIRAAIVAATGARTDTRFLELGVGTGRVALPFIQAGDHYTGVDLSLGMMAELRRKLAGGPARPQLIQGDVMHVPLRTASFDIVIFVHVLHLVDSWQLVLEEARRVLRAGGWLVASQSGWNWREGAPPSTAELIGRRWNAILGELGIDRSVRSRGTRLTKQQVIDALAGLGAQARLLTLLEYRAEGGSPRQIVEHYRRRTFSSEWDTPDDIHAEAARRLAAWLEQECPEPDVAGIEMRQFQAVVAHFPG
jgi:SAM-dependent methyltransferase